MADRRWRYLRAHIRRACSPLVILLSLILIGLAAAGAMPRPDPAVPFLGFVEMGVWV